MNAELRIAIVDNEPLFVNALSWHLDNHLDRPCHLVGHGKPRDLASASSTALLTHAVVDVSFGPFDLSSADMAPESETAVDALLHLQDLAPQCQAVVTTVMAGEFAREVAVVVRQTWPEIRILNKNDDRIAEQVTAFVNGSEVPDNAEWGRLVRDIEAIAPEQISEAIRLCAETRPVAALAIALAQSGHQPSAAELADVLKLSQSRIANLLALLGSTIRSSGAAVLEFETNGLELWRWARPRRVLLERHLKSLV